MPARDLPLLIEAARAAGEIATRYSGKLARRWDKPEGAGPVTEADIAVNDMLAAMLPSARPGYGWLSEETEDDGARLNHDRLFIVDPIDGTRSFADGKRTWAHSIAVAEHGRITAAVIYLPLLDRLFAAAEGQGATLNAVPIATSQPAGLSTAEILATRPNLEPTHWRDGHVPAFARAYRPSLAYRLALVAQGRFDGMLTLRPSWEWDIAAGDLILREARGRCTDRHGAALRFNNSHPTVEGVIAAGPLVHRALSEALEPDDAVIPGTPPDPPAP
ncbi:myo-inositol-1(or 4)-monophosphatase [Cribrihabitans marinus]|uniref:Myo-inositol-1(Or 4)-monophosphatase n=1 Tax=Cribrihabitans marinus TaxID=1227549 RepID=A0A1H6Y1R9_9RHOB|nr:3'(2'),5'-bisphosphate nucleotidase CysQ [Cribrihabitans marinus]GGH27820.1 3'(2'),5'-bisphosphate nucleotidase CysQ [Cribrihabitans marinus]SEJ31042.1 myo-inositol-1(or 4)-monophosphatase [Cribrihabitans marinus]